MRLTARIVGIVIGGALGVAAFTIAHSTFNWRPHFANDDIQTHAPQEYRHGGVVIHHDEADKMITIQAQNSFVAGTSTERLRFVYDDATQWSSLEFIFRDNILTRRTEPIHERMRTLPEGTRVWLTRDPTQSEQWKIASLIFLRRTDL